MSGPPDLCAQARKPIAIDRVLDDPAVFKPLVERHTPYFPVQRYFAGGAEYRASSGQGDGSLIAPNFRGDWAYDAPLVDGAELFLFHPALIRAASELFETEFVRPQAVYANLTWQLPFHQGSGHTDVPAFRGIDRTRYPIWLLAVMGHSGLFEAERICIATAVAWFYEGSDGGFEYWPNGPDQPPLVHEGEIFNTAIMGDNDRMFHRVRPVGRPDDGLLSGLTLDSRLEHTGEDAWHIVTGNETRSELEYASIRISVSWKARVFRDEHELREIEEHSHDLRLEEVWGRLLRDLAARGIECEAPSEPLSDPHFIDTLSRTYRREPTVFV